ncbi:MAG: enoyl-CoA hydratase-related protein [Bacteriovoracaceae bacterium]|jgi:enoyl-CoA hydratase/carnithine racemase|nr:enoyl-CoA hydratase-related protein [Bacteriovoracaceae bacterium]
MSYENLTDLNLELKDHSLWITLNRPSASNAFTDDMIKNLVSTLFKADEDPNIRCIVITGEGKHFCAGGDVKQMKQKQGMFAGEPNELRNRYKFGIQQIPLCFERLATPVVAMINGAAIGAGLDLACMCDIRICSDKAKFGETFTKLGLIPGDGGTYFLQRVVGLSKAMEMTLTADIYDSTQALNMGLVSTVTTSEYLLEKTTNIVDRICKNAPIATSMAKRSINHAYRADLNSTLDLLAAYQGISQRTSDHFSAVDALLNKSQTNFKNK